MSISAIMNTATSGMLAQQTRVNNAAQNIANMDTPGYKRLRTELSSTASGVKAKTVQSQEEPATPDSSTVDPLDEMVDLISSENSFKANAKVFEAGADLWDVLMTMKKDD
ncbi:flagellar basal body rod protein FlgC [Rhizobium paknamense]|uniref:Flagellar basal-body rod protein FlgC n=1 Tax=Rhizobium paknamense TaxID=1206817 RepID=A0ABU0IFS0_9HYPH|nr:flagellar basal body protein [Rhizobium paknamense]MDQ0456096.1 flagellar basal-body rod protein FlgC [Rhizobium paknamense]